MFFGQVQVAGADERFWLGHMCWCLLQLRGDLYIVKGCGGCCPRLAVCRVVWGTYECGLRVAVALPAGGWLRLQQLICVQVYAASGSRVFWDRQCALHPASVGVLV